MRNLGRARKGWKAIGWTGGLLALCAVGWVAVGWVALHQVPGVAPAVADAGRAVLGEEAVARLEDGVYALSDRLNLWRYRNTAPKAYWQPSAPAAKPGIGTVSAAAVESAPPGRPNPPSPAAPSFRPADVGPLYKVQAATGDGQWLPADPKSVEGDPLSYKTLIHPDPERSYAELFVVALDLARVDLHAVPGTHEPESSVEGAHAFRRSGRVPAQHIDLLLAAFNGGFKSVHGRFGMAVDGITLAAPRPTACTIAYYQDGRLQVGTHENLPDLGQLTWFRQTPGCMVENGRRHPRLANSKSWGATVDGDTVIRRSALGLDAEGRTLYVGISNSTTAEALARGMQHAGSFHVAQLDVNYSYPRFLFYKPTPEGLQTLPLAEGFVYSKGQYVEHKSSRDFFYLTRKAPELANSEGPLG